MRTALFVSIIVFMQGAHAGSLSADVARQAQQNWPEFLDLLAIPNVADQPADIQRNATFLEQAFAKRGFKVRRLDNPAKRPAVFAELASSSAQARTVLLYAHFDGQPVIPENWSQADPFRPVVKRRDAQGKWQEVGRRAAAGEPARSRAARVRAFRVRRQGADRDAADRGRPAARAEAPAINVKVLLDPEEEKWARRASRA
jgi:hypothetical protein